MPHTWGTVNAPHAGHGVTHNRGMSTGKKIRTKRQIELSSVLATNWARLHAARSGLADKPLADAMGVGHGTIARLRAGSHATTLDTLATVADHFGFEVWQLLVPDFYPDAPPTLGPDASSEPVSAPTRRRAKEKAHA